MPIALTSDFPSTPNETVFTAMRARTNKPTIAWIPPFTDRNEERFARAKEQFALHGFSQMEYCDIDEATDHAMLSRLATFDVVYLAGGDPLRFRRNIARVRLGERLRECLAAGCLIVGASGGALQLTPNVSLYRLVDYPIEQVLAERAAYEALGFVDQELLPHLNRHGPEFLDRVRKYTLGISNEVVGLADGAALLQGMEGTFECVGTAVRFHHGEMVTVDPI